MKLSPSLAFTLVFLLLASMFTQAQQTLPAQQPTTDNDEVVRITTNLVQVDAVVTDNNGRQVTDLGPEDFEIQEDSRAQKITNFSYVSTDASTPLRAATPGGPTKGNAPPARLRPEQVRRTIALVVDDLGLSFESAAQVRRALKKFVDEQMQAGDLVAIIRTGGGIGALQQFTSDKRQLYATIERLRWNPLGSGGLSAIAPFTTDPLTTHSEQQQAAQASASTNRNPTQAFDEARGELFAVGTLGAINYVVNGLRDLPGRKSVVLFSDGLAIFNSEGQSERILDTLRRLTDLANRASVVIYTMDARGLQTLGLTAADSTTGLGEAQVRDMLDTRRTRFFESQNGLNYLAQQTGGLFIRNSNDLAGGIKRVLDDQKGYYLIGYRPDESTFDARTGARRFHKISVKVKRPGLHVRSRTGFYGITDEEARPAARRTREAQLIGALASPFSAGGIRLRLTSLFGNDARAGSFMRSLVHIDARDLTFTDEPEGWHKASFDVLAVTFGDNGIVVDEVSRTHTVRVRGGTYERVMRDGFVYVITVPVRKPGAYQLRAALRDAASEHVGSVSQFIEVPDLRKDRLTLSGLVVEGADPAARNQAQNSKPVEAATPANAAQTSADAAAYTNPQAGPAVRRFQQGMILQYGYVIYNAQLERASNLPQLQIQIRVFRDRQEIYTGKVLPFDASGQPDLKRIIAGGQFQLGTQMPPGEYVLQVIVTDPLAQEKYRTATQWIDFEIVK